MTKIGAIARYEVLMAWRRRSLPILWMLLLVDVLIFALLVEAINRGTPLMGEGIQRTASDPNAPAWARGIDMVVTMRTLATINTLGFGTLLYVAGVTLMLGEVIPLDRQFRVRELLDALPLKPAVYLGGKVASAWAGLLIGVAVVGVICAVALRLIFGEYDLRVFVMLWISLYVPQTMIAALISVLAMSRMGSRRASVLIGLLVVPLVLLLTGSTANAFSALAALIEPVYALGVLMSPAEKSDAEIISQMIGALLEYVVVGLVVWTGVWGWTRLREV